MKPHPLPGAGWRDRLAIPWGWAGFPGEALTEGQTRAAAALAPPGREPVLARPRKGAGSSQSRSVGAEDETAFCDARPFGSKTRKAERQSGRSFQTKRPCGAPLPPLAGTGGKVETSRGAAPVRPAIRNNPKDSFCVGPSAACGLPQCACRGECESRAMVG